MTEQTDRAGLVAAGVGLRLAAMIYEALLIFGIVFAVSYVVLASMRWSYPLAPVPRTVVQLTLFLAIGAYFTICWIRSGQTLALKAWQLRVVDVDGRPPRAVRAALRYLLAWHLWLPGLLLAAALQLQGGIAVGVVVAGFALMLLPAMFDRDRRLLHDRWTGTRIVRVPV